MRERARSRRASPATRPSIRRRRCSSRSRSGARLPSLSDQTINFTSTPPAAATIGAADYTVAASASSGLAVAFSASAGSAGVCSVSGSTVSLLGAGTCTILADQAGLGRLQPGAAGTAVVRGRPRVAGDQLLVDAARPRRGRRARLLDLGVRELRAAGHVRRRAGERRHLHGLGLDRVPRRSRHLLVVASQAGNAVYDPADPVQQSFTVGPGAPTLSPQTISFTSTAPGGAVVGGPPTRSRASASSGSPSSSRSRRPARACAPSPARPSRSSASAPARSTRTRPATRATSRRCRCSSRSRSRRRRRRRRRSASPRARPARPSTAASRTRSRRPRAPAFPVGFSAAPSSAGVCTVSGSTVTLVGVGTCTVNANQAGNGSYLAAPQVQQSFTVARAPQTITFTSTRRPVDRNGPPTRLGHGHARAWRSRSASRRQSSGICAISGSWVYFTEATATASSARTRPATPTTCRRRRCSSRSPWSAG